MHDENEGNDELEILDDICPDVTGLVLCVIEEALVEVSLETPRRACDCGLNVGASTFKPVNILLVSLDVVSKLSFFTFILYF